MEGVEEFKAVVEAARGGGHAVAVPDAVAQGIGAKHMMRVAGTVDGTPYRSNVAKMGGRLILGVHKATLAAAGRDTGDEVTVTIEPDSAPR
jgi:hypothetical protein